MWLWCQHTLKFLSNLVCEYMVYKHFKTFNLPICPISLHPMFLLETYHPLTSICSQYQTFVQQMVAARLLFAAPTIWNSLTTSLCPCSTLPTFLYSLKSQFSTTIKLPTFSSPVKRARKKLFPTPSPVMLVLVPIHYCWFQGERGP